MRKFLFASVALAALGSAPAFAADLRLPQTRVQPTPEFFSWTGFYLGTHTGVASGWTRSSNRSPFGGFDAFVPLSYELNPSSIMSGVQLGYNMQSGAFVGGIEIDLGYLGARERIVQGNDLVAVRYGWYSTFTGRLGLAADRLLTYIKGGAVVAGLRNTASDVEFDVNDPSDFSQTKNSRWGWTLGTGMEYAFTQGWTVKTEYLFMDFGKRNSTNLDGDSFEHRNQMHTWKVGLNYRIGGR
jgi:outer membrane immunogenic protein